MKISVFTPLYKAGNAYIRETWESMRDQTHADWEWVILENRGGVVPSEAAQDPRVKVVRSENPHGVSGISVGALKSEACSHCNGDVYVELDHDDLLHPRALEIVALEVSRGAEFVFSDFAEFHDGTWLANPYNAAFGWRHYMVDCKGHTLVACEAPEDPVAWRRIEWAPNHLRAWTAELYAKLGGHRPELAFADDHDLVLRSYLIGARCVRIPECLYFYRVHEQQNVRTNNARIQALEAVVYNEHIYALAEKVALEKDLGFPLLDLCGAHGCPKNYRPIDREACPGRDDCIPADLDGKWPLPSDSVGVLRAFDAIEHLRDPVNTMNEAWRVLCPGGFMLIMVPSTDAIVEARPNGHSELINGSGAYCDPTHVSFWNRLSFRYYSDPNFAKYLGPRLQARFQIARLETINNGGIPYVRAELIALKPGYQPMGSVSGI